MNATSLTASENADIERLVRQRRERSRTMAYKYYNDGEGQVEHVGIDMSDVVYLADPKAYHRLYAKRWRKFQSERKTPNESEKH